MCCLLIQKAVVQRRQKGGRELFAWRCTGLRRSVVFVVIETESVSSACAQITIFSQFCLLWVSTSIRHHVTFSIAFISRECLFYLPAFHFLLNHHGLPSTPPNVSQSPSSELSSSGFLSVESESEDPLAQLAEEVKQQPFTTNKSLQQSLECCQRELQQDQTRDQYLVFTSVPLEQSSRLSNNQSQTSKYGRFFFNTETGTLLAKVVLNPACELAIRSFDLLISLKLHAMNIHHDVRPLDSTTVTVGNWKKEADYRAEFVVEVGLLESA